MISEPLILLGGVCLFISIFGFYMASVLHRPTVFRVKLCLLYTIPLCTGFSILTSKVFHHPTNIILLVVLFILGQSILYWREIRSLTTTEGFYRRSLDSFIKSLPDMFWMKDLNNRFTYVNDSICRDLLKCDSKFAIGKTSIEIAEYHREQGRDYTFGEICVDSDDIITKFRIPQRFLEYGKVNGDFLALQVYKAPLLKYNPVLDENELLGTIGIGRDLTYDFNDHEILSWLLSEGRMTEVLDLFEKHKKRFLFSGIDHLKTEVDKEATSSAMTEESECIK